MESGYFDTLFDYNRWATERVLKAAEPVSAEDFTKHSNFPHGGLRDTMVHAMSAEWIWRSRCQHGESPRGFLSPAEFPTLESVAARWREEHESWLEFVNGLGAEDFDRTVYYSSTAGAPQATILKMLLGHVVNHSTQRRAEVAAMLTDLGCSPGDIDFILYLRQR